MPVVAGMVQFFGARIHDRFRAVQDYFGDISARVQENLAGVRVVRAFTQEHNEVETFKRMNREYVDRNRSLIRLTATFYPMLHALIGVCAAAVFVVSGGWFSAHEIIGAIGPAFLDELLYNRRWSLLFEGHRWIDHRRFGRLNALPRDLSTHVIVSRLPMSRTNASGSPSTACWRPCRPAPCRTSTTPNAPSTRRPSSVPANVPKGCT